MMQEVSWSLNHNIASINSIYERQLLPTASAQGRSGMQHKDRQSLTQFLHHFTAATPACILKLKHVETIAVCRLTPVKNFIFTKLTKFNQASPDSSRSLVVAIL